MKAVLAIARTTIRSSLRSNVVHVLLALLLLAVVVLPLTIMGDGSARGLIQVSLTYSLGLVGVLLSFVTIWLGCTVITDDIEGYQAHLVLSKPVSRTTFWLGKLTGILVFQGVLLLIAALSIYGLTMWRFHYGDFSPEERQEIRGELLVGRQLIPPEKPDIESLVEEELNQRLRNLEARGEESSNPMTEQQARGTIRREILGAMSEVPAGAQPRPWRFDSLPRFSDNQDVYFRFRLYVDSATSKDQRLTSGIWWVLNSGDNRWYPATEAGLAQYMGGVWHQLRIDPEFLRQNDELVIAYENRDMLGKSVVFQISDGPQLMVPSTGFLMNYTRVILLTFCQILFLAILGCTCGALLSTPVAIFVSFSYVILGMVITAMEPATPDDVVAPQGLIDWIALWIREAASFVMVSVNEFNHVDLLARGQLIEFSLIFAAILQVLILRGLPIAIIGNFLLRKRELGLVIRR